METYLERDLKMGEGNTEDVSITVSDQSPGQLKAHGEGWRQSLCLEHYLARGTAPGFWDRRRMF